MTSLNIEGQGAQNAIDVTTVGLYVAAAIAALTAVVGIAIALVARDRVQRRQPDHVERAGLGPRHRVFAAGAVGIPVALVGAMLAVVGAALASAIFPIGVAAKAEPDPGIRLDPAAIGIGFAVIVATVLAVAAIAGHPDRARDALAAAAARPSMSGRMTAEWGAPPPVAVGVRFALDRGTPAPCASGSVVVARGRVRGARGRGGPGVLERSAPPGDHARAVRLDLGSRRLRRARRPSVGP